MNARYHKGQFIYKGNKVYGVVVEVEPTYVIVNMVKPTYSGSDMRDDAGIPAGTKMKQALIGNVQIKGDPNCQVPTYNVIDGTELQPHMWAEPLPTKEAIDDETYERLLAGK